MDRPSDYVRKEVFDRFILFVKDQFSIVAKEMVDNKQSMRSCEDQVNNFVKSMSNIRDGLFLLFC